MHGWINFAIGKCTVYLSTLVIPVGVLVLCKLKRTCTLLKYFKVAHKRHHAVSAFLPGTHHVACVATLFDHIDTNIYMVYSLYWWN